jgi:hypothetical protein
MTNALNLSTSTSYSYDSSGNPAVQLKLPLHIGGYTTLSKTTSSCTTSTFYDTLVITTYNDQAHSVWQSVPFEVTHGSGWVDPNGVKDYQGVTPGGTVTFYDALGRAIATQDPLYGSSQEPGIACSATLTGTHTYTLDPNGQVLTDVSGSRTIGYNDDLLGRVGCVQDNTPTINATGACSAGNHFVVNTYDSSKLTVSGTTDYPKGELTQSVSKTYVTGSPGGDTVTTTESYEHDARGRLSAEQMQFGTLPSDWGITANLPSYLAQYTYNDADQPTTTATSTTPSGQGYTTTQVYDTTTGVPTGVSNNGSATANLATVVYNARAQLDTINFQTSLGNPLASEQFGYDASGTRVMRRTTTGSGTTMRVYAFGLEQHTYAANGSHTSDLYYYSLAGKLLGYLDTSSNTTGFYLTDTLGSVLVSFSNTDHSAAIAGNQVFGPYAYVGGNPETRNDPTGNCAVCTFLRGRYFTYKDRLCGMCLKRTCRVRRRSSCFSIIHTKLSSKD